MNAHRNAIPAAGHNGGHEDGRKIKRGYRCDLKAFVISRQYEMAIQQAMLAPSGRRGTGPDAAGEAGSRTRH